MSKLKMTIWSKCVLLIIGVIFYPDEDGNVLDIQADMIGPSKYIVYNFDIQIWLLIIFSIYMLNFNSVWFSN